jgi:lipoprotein
VTVDYTVAKLSDLKKAIPSDFSGPGDKVSFKASKEGLIKIGYTEKK